MIPSAWFRIVSKRRTGRELLRSQSGRFHDDPETDPTSYVADGLLTAWLEVTAHLGLVPANPEAFRAWRVELSPDGLLDFRSAKQRGRWKISEEELLLVPAPLRLREVARAIRTERKYQGLVYASVRNRPRGICAVLFLENFAKGPTCELVPSDDWKDFIHEVTE